MLLKGSREPGLSARPHIKPHILLLQEREAHVGDNLALVRVNNTVFSSEKKLSHTKYYKTEQERTALKPFNYDNILRCKNVDQHKNYIQKYQ